MPYFEKHFTLEEARAWLPELRRRFGRIRSLYVELEGLREDYERALRLIRSNGHSPAASPFEERVSQLQALLQEIVQAGIEIKDVQRGLVDFPHMRDGEEVFLCWEMGEEDILYWHRLQDGYAGREPL
jgi:hypothetical protein